jgi:hypothetical protein
MNKQVAIWMSAFMIVAVTCMALLFAFTDVMSDRLNGNKRIIFIFVLAAYSLYRAYRLKQLFKEPNA